MTHFVTRFAKGCCNKHVAPKLSRVTGIFVSVDDVTRFGGGLRQRRKERVQRPPSKVTQTMETKYVKMLFDYSNNCHASLAGVLTTVAAGT